MGRLNRARPSCADWTQTLLAHVTIRKPPGDGPFPVVIQLHGCGGVRPFMAHYTQAAVKAGVATVTVDSLTPRGIGRLQANLMVCSGLILKGAERAGDLYVIYEWVRQQAWADPDRIAASGWSHGGWTIMDAIAAGADAPRYCRLGDLAGNPLKGLKAALLVYPYAGFPAMTIGRGWGDHQPKVFALLGGKDQVVGVRQPNRSLDRLTRDGLAVEKLFFADATHAFDDDAPSDPRSTFREDLRSQAMAWYAASLKSALVPPVSPEK